MLELGHWSVMAMAKECLRHRREVRVELVDRASMEQVLAATVIKIFVRRCI